MTASKCGKNKWSDNLGEISSAECIVISEFTLTSACGEIVTLLAHFLQNQTGDQDASRNPKELGRHYQLKNVHIYR